MKKAFRTNRVLRQLLGILALVMLGVGSALGMTELLLRTFPNWVPPEVRVNPPARRVKAFIDETYDLRLSDGDLFHLMQGTLATLAPEEDRVIARVHMTTDAHGFRNNPPEQATYDIVALGDSFTRASGVAIPWPQKVAEYTGIDVLNLGDVGFGPQDELTVLRQYGLKKHPQWVIMAYFEGNDLHDAAAYAQANPFILTRFAKHVLSQFIDTWQERKLDGVQAAVAPTFRYPIRVTINHVDLEMVFFSYYISWLSVSREAIESSQNYRFVTETIIKVKELSEAADAHFLLVYIPTKFHIYQPYLNDPVVLARVFTNVPTVELHDEGQLVFSNKPATPDLIRQHMDDQSRLLSDFAVENHIAYIDLTPTFQEEAGTGAELYFPFDTHWNQKGHDLAAQTISKYVEGMSTVGVSKDQTE